MHRKTYLNIDLDDFKHNYDFFKRKTKKEIIPILKANGYGLGDVLLAKKAQALGAKIIGVSSYEEAYNLRKNGIKTEILILGYVEMDDLKDVIKNDFSIITPSLKYILDAKSKNYSFKGMKIHLKIDTGMSRLGFMNFEETKNGLEILLEEKSFVEGVMTHFASASFEDKSYLKRQFNLFKDIVERLKYNFKYIHCDNSDASINFDDNGFSNFSRVGLGLFGFSSFKTNLKPIVKLYSHITNIKELEEDVFVGYDCKYKTTKKEKIGILPIGYADGFLRKNTGLRVFSNDKYYKIVGNICMDQLMVKIDDDVAFDQRFEIFGDHVSILEIAKRNKMIVYEVLTLLSDRVCRCYFENGKKVFEETSRFKNC